MICIIILLWYFVFYNKHASSLTCNTGYGYSNSTNTSCVKCTNANQYIDSNKICQTCSGTTPYLNASNNECVASCSVGSFLDITKNQCLKSCPLTQFYDNTNSYCLSVCPTGQLVDITNTCCLTVCPTGQFINSANTACVSACPTGQFNSYGTCILSCPSTSFVSSDGLSCYSVCPTGQYSNSNNVCSGVSKLVITSATTDAYHINTLLVFDTNNVLISSSVVSSATAIMNGTTNVGYSCNASTTCISNTLINTFGSDGGYDSWSSGFNIFVITYLFKTPVNIGTIILCPQGGVLDIRAVGSVITLYDNNNNLLYTSTPFPAVLSTYTIFFLQPYLSTTSYAYSVTSAPLLAFLSLTNIPSSLKNSILSTV